VKPRAKIYKQQSFLFRLFAYLKAQLLQGHQVVEMHSNAFSDFRRIKDRHGNLEYKQFALDLNIIQIYKKHFYNKFVSQKYATRYRINEFLFDLDTANSEGTFTDLIEALAHTAILSDKEIRNYYTRAKAGRILERRQQRK
jgi:hypothetical protein